MPPRPLIRAAAVLFCTLLSAQDDGEAAFDRGYAGVRQLLQKSRWAEARAAIDALLAQHQQQPYAIGQRDVVVEDYRMCCFYLDTPVPKPDQLVSGKLEAYSPARGTLRIRYDRQHLQDWQQLPNGMLLHPATFRDNFTVSIEGPLWPHGASSLGILFEFADQHALGLELGDSDWAGFVEHGDGEPRVLEQKRIKVKQGDPLRIALRVGRTRADLLCERRPVLQLKRDLTAAGTVALLGGPFDEVLLEGEVEPSWLQGLLDEHLSQQREAYEKAFVPQQKLPQWLFVDPPVQRTPPRFPDAQPPMRLSAGSAAVLGYLQRRQYDRAAAALAQLPADCPAGVAAWLRGLCLQRQGNSDDALAPSREAAAALPEFTFAQLLHAEVLHDLRQPQAALQLLQQALLQDPGEVEVYRALLPLQLLLGRGDEAERTLRTARTRHGLGADLAQFDVLLAMARRGPAWHRRCTWRSAHYEITSDIDLKVCQQAGRILEQAYVNLKGQLSWVDDKAAPPFRVFLFAGEAGYQDYCKQILGSEVPHTAGLYTPVLEQLLIWNVPRREDMERTIRHEGFHQFLDRAMTDPPVWFNEGLAEYYETGRYQGGRFRGGQSRPDHLATLLRSKKLLPKLREFVYGARADFYANAQLRYAQGWALVHLLREGERSHQQLFAKLWQALASDASRRAALDQAFAGVDFDALEREFWAHVQRLTREK